MAGFMDMMKKATELQSKMQQMQADLEALEVEGMSGGGVVKVVLNGKGDLKSVHIDDSLMRADEKEILEDLLVTAHADARKKSESAMAEKMKDLTGGLPLPPGLKLPFG